MAAYNYNTFLPTPNSWANVNFDNPSLLSGITTIANGLRKEVSSLSAPKGIIIENKVIKGFDGEDITCLLIKPKGVTQNVPIMLYCYGGGFFLPIQPMMVHLGAYYAKSLNIVVIIPQYRLWPSYTSPYPFKDCLTTWKWILKNATELKIDLTSLLLYGESVGGALAAGLANWQSQKNSHNIPKPLGQLTIYPVLDNRCSLYHSMVKYSQAPWPLKNHLSMWQNYLKNGLQEPEAYIIPMKTNDFTNLLSTYIEAAQIDILHDEALAYANKLQNSQVAVQYHEIEGAYHGFDLNIENNFVQTILTQRIAAMRQMLNERK